MPDRNPVGLLLDILGIDVLFCPIKLVFIFLAQVDQEIHVLAWVVLKLDVLVKTNAFLLENVATVPADKTNIDQIVIFFGLQKKNYLGCSARLAALRKCR